MDINLTYTRKYKYPIANDFDVDAALNLHERKKETNLREFSRCRLVVKSKRENRMVPRLRIGDIGWMSMRNEPNEEGRRGDNLLRLTRSCPLKKLRTTTRAPVCLIWTCRYPGRTRLGFQRTCQQRGELVHANFTCELARLGTFRTRSTCQQLPFCTHGRDGRSLLIRWLR